MARTKKTTKAGTKIKVADNNFLLNNKTEIAIKRLKSVSSDQVELTKK